MFHLFLHDLRPNPYHSCAALPLVNSAGTSITCTTADDLAARLAAVRSFPRLGDCTSSHADHQTGATGAGGSNDNNSNTGNGDAQSGTGATNGTDGTNNAGDGSAAGNTDTGDIQSSLSTRPFTVFRVE